MIATDSLSGKPIAGAIVSGESEKEAIFLLESMKSWLTPDIKLATIDFSPRLESGLKKVFPGAMLQKCVFHAVQLLTRGLNKELSRVKKQELLDYIDEWRTLRKLTFLLERGGTMSQPFAFKFPEVRLARKVHEQLVRCLSGRDHAEVEKRLNSFLSSNLFLKWSGRKAFLTRHDAMFTKRKLKYSEKGLKYIVPRIHEAFRFAIREARVNLEHLKSDFNKAKYLIMKNPINMTSQDRNNLRKYLKVFPWLRNYRKILVKFYYQFRLPSSKRGTLSFLEGLINVDSHPWLKSAVKTLIANEENVFRFQVVSELFPHAKPSKSIKVVNESCNKQVNKLFRTQCGMRTIRNARMRISRLLGCPIIVSPSILNNYK